MGTTTLLNTGMEALINKLGLVEAERFIALIIREPFNYTEWRRDNIFKDMTVEQISGEAMEYVRKEESK
ncbi:MAG: hypothetical protein LBL91_02560 [Lachnospiraceae bacterium]|jgi:hypothetical protein|nr:hypothetical protein [Lachnospiraceae bacterium]